jgi:hypothetical protein
MTKKYVVDLNETLAGQPSIGVSRSPPNARDKFKKLYPVREEL